MPRALAARRTVTAAVALCDATSGQRSRNTRSDASKTTSLAHCPYTGSLEPQICCRTVMHDTVGSPSTAARAEAGLPGGTHPPMCPGDEASRRSSCNANPRRERGSPSGDRRHRPERRGPGSFPGARRREGRPIGAVRPQDRRTGGGAVPRAQPSPAEELSAGRDHRSRAAAVARAEACAQDFYAALDAAVAKLEARMRRSHDRRRITAPSHPGHGRPRRPDELLDASSRRPARDPQDAELDAADDPPIPGGDARRRTTCAEPTTTSTVPADRAARKVAHRTR